MKTKQTLILTALLILFSGCIKDDFAAVQQTKIVDISNVELDSSTTTLTGTFWITDLGAGTYEWELSTVSDYAVGAFWTTKEPKWTTTLPLRNPSGRTTYKWRVRFYPTGSAEPTRWFYGNPIIHVVIYV